MKGGDLYQSNSHSGITLGMRAIGKVRICLGCLGILKFFTYALAYLANVTAASDDAPSHGIGG